MSHSLGTIAVSPDGSAYVNDIVIRRNLPIPAGDTKSYLHETHGGANTRLEVYVTQGRAPPRSIARSWASMSSTRSSRPMPRSTVDVGLSYDSNGVVQVQAVQRDTARRLPMTVEPVPDDLSWLGAAARDVPWRLTEPELIRVFLLIDVSSSMTGPAARRRPRRPPASSCRSATSRRWKWA